jgi:hypothetical protein
MHGTNTGELYDLQRDPSETNNLWHNPSYRQVQFELLLRMSDRMAWTVDPLPPRAANY